MKKNLVVFMPHTGEHVDMSHIVSVITSSSPVNTSDHIITLYGVKDVVMPAGGKTREECYRVMKDIINTIDLSTMSKYINKPSDDVAYLSGEVDFAADSIFLYPGIFAVGVLCSSLADRRS